MGKAHRGRSLSGPQTGGGAEGPGTLRQQSLPPLGPFAPHALARGVGPGGPPLQTRHALGMECVHHVAHGLFATPDLACNPWPPGTLLAGQHDLAAPPGAGVRGPESSLPLLALRGS